MASHLPGMSGKRSFKRWDDIEERMLAEAVKNFGVKVLNMTFELATMIGLGKGSAGNEDRQDIEAAVRSLECLELLEKLGPAPRELKKNQLKKSTKPSSDGLTRIPSIRYRYHPFQRDDRLRQVCEEADFERKREAVGRYLTHVNLLEEVLSPARPDGMNDEDAMKDDEDKLVKTKMEGGKLMVYDEQTLKAQEAVTSGLLDILKLAESMGTLDEEPKGIKREEVKSTGDENGGSMGWEDSPSKLFVPGELRKLSQEEVAQDFFNTTSMISRYEWKTIGL
ncbi:hypothetical protein GUITHDRAFT_135150 [Guillardia theta CCMP2712]|uniref:Uncharacterized protein n=1 Tax=Guillardia theta (strain CCMP2712) TaxID=905079 RepID=L1JQW3_GUITC|nr:hypothetical protein GUITHDRAFT_135150 [Guillardia theta CCMP2712]EKX50478.1 hypothetical protein GUITHDRAFT_135150 [Guillardia theta CCMP2712]|eukprot:XP_005837458.1 hypothetical protein GUITHDRAFT_135150 [Guillardia theta CCMP2712]